MTGKQRHRAGYALIMVLVFMVLFTALVGVAFRRLGSAVRFETAHGFMLRRDAGSLQALAMGLALLETGLPPSDPYICGTTINTPSGPRSFSVTFRVEDGTRYSVRVAPAQPDDSLLDMPSTFAVAP